MEPGLEQHLVEACLPTQDCFPGPGLCRRRFVVKAQPRNGAAAAAGAAAGDCDVTFQDASPV